MREQVGLLAYSPLAQGSLTGKYLDGARPAGARITLFNRGQRYETVGRGDRDQQIYRARPEFGLDPAQMALAFVNSRPFLTSTIIGATTMEQLRDRHRLGRRDDLARAGSRASTRSTSSTAIPAPDLAHAGRARHQDALKPELGT